MEKQGTAGLKPEEKLEEGGNSCDVVQMEALGKLVAKAVPQPMKRELTEGLQRGWEAQWSEFLNVPHSRKKNVLPLSGHDVKDYQASLKGAPEAPGPLEDATVSPSVLERITSNPVKMSFSRDADQGGDRDTTLMGDDQTMTKEEENVRPERPEQAELLETSVGKARGKTVPFHKEDEEGRNELASDRQQEDHPGKGGGKVILCKEGARLQRVQLGKKVWEWEGHTMRSCQCEEWCLAGSKVL
ncbi:UNVERIFIED_CONTAM: hypothetical protein K2H54_061337 [Gekko kuhli]